MKNNNGFIQIPILVCTLAIVTFVIGAGAVEYNKISKIISESDRLIEEEKYYEAIEALEFTQDKWVVRNLRIKKEEIDSKIEESERKLLAGLEMEVINKDIDLGIEEEPIDILVEEKDNNEIKETLSGKKIIPKVNNTLPELEINKSSSVINEKNDELVKSQEDILPTQQEKSVEQLESKFKVNSVKLDYKDNYLRFEWTISAPGESRLSIWPPHEIPNKDYFISNSKSAAHFVEVPYSKLPIYSFGIGLLDDYLSYNYRIDAVSGDFSEIKEGRIKIDGLDDSWFVEAEVEQKNISATKEGHFSLKDKVNTYWAETIISFNPELSCDQIGPFKDIDKLFCKNLSGYLGSEEFARKYLGEK